MRKLVALAVVAALLVVGDIGTRAYAASTLEGQLSAALRLHGRPRVAIDEFPFTLGLARGEINEIRISAEGIRSSEIELSEATITLNDVRFSPSQALSGDLKSVDFSAAHGSALITLQALEDAVDRFPIDFTIPEIDLSSVRLDQNALDMGPFHMELPVIAEGMEYEAMHVVDGGLHLIFSLDGDRLRL